jgi:glycosyltransferase involved in cell wall biosynthesis
VNLVSCGRISREKGMDLAADACKILVDRGYHKIHWWIVGGGPEEQQLRQQIDRLGLGDHMTVTGMQKNPHPYIGAADLYVQPSRFEGYPMTVLEALILGRVVISTDNGGAGEMVEKGKTGLLCPISAEGIADAVQKLLEDPALLEQLRRNVAALDMEAENQKNLSRLEELF